MGVPEDIRFGLTHSVRTTVLSSFLPFPPLQEDLVGFRDLIPPMLNVLRTVGQQPNGEEVMYEILDVLEDLASQPVAVLNAHVPDLVPFLIEMIKGGTTSATVRGAIASFLSWSANHSKASWYCEMELAPFNGPAKYSPQAMPT